MGKKRDTCSNFPVHCAGSSPLPKAPRIIRGQAASRDVEQATRERESYSNAARVLLENGNEEGAIEIAANAWRLWIMARDLDGGRVFLASVLEKGEKKPSADS